jgi:hypothetical protein
MRAVLALTVIVLAVLSGPVSAAHRSNGLREALGLYSGSKSKFAGANICTIVVCDTDVEVKNAGLVIPALVNAAGKNHIAINAYQQGAPPGAVEGITGASTNNAAAKARAKKAIAQLVTHATNNACDEVNVLGHGANNRIGYTFNAADPKGQDGEMVRLNDIFAALSAIPAVTTINFMVCLCNVAPHAKLGLCENRILSAGYRNGAPGFIGVPAMTVPVLTQQLIDSGIAAPTPLDISQQFVAYNTLHYDPLWNNYYNNPKTAPAQNVPHFRQIIADFGGQVDFITPNGAGWANAKIA